MINTLWLRSFCTLVEVGHFTRTAERLRMTQSGVSQHVRKLEEQLGAQLLLRQGKQFSLSDAGEKLYADAQSILQALENLETSVGEDPPFEGLVRLMSPGSVGLKLYPHLLALQCQYPKLSIEYRFAPNSDVENAVAETKVDIGVMTSKPTLADLSFQVVGEESLLLVTPANIKTPDWASLMALGFIHHPDANHHASLLLGANYSEFQHVNQFPKKGFSNQIGLILEPVSLGLGFTVLPVHAVNAFAKSEQIKVHRLGKPVSETLYLCHRRHRRLQRRILEVAAEARKWL